MTKTSKIDDRLTLSLSVARVGEKYPSAVWPTIIIEREKAGWKGRHCDISGTTTKRVQCMIERGVLPN